MYEGIISVGTTGLTSYLRKPNSILKDNFIIQINSQLI